MNRHANRILKLIGEHVQRADWLAQRHEHEIYRLETARRNLLEISARLHGDAAARISVSDERRLAQLMDTVLMASWRQR